MWTFQKSYDMKNHVRRREPSRPCPEPGCRTGRHFQSNRHFLIWQFAGRWQNLPASASSRGLAAWVTARARWESRVSGILRQNVPVGRKSAWRGPSSNCLFPRHGKVKLGKYFPIVLLLRSSLGCGSIAA
jgi:hypothetical protein